jgi:hypothetical protein
MGGKDTQTWWWSHKPIFFPFRKESKLKTHKQFSVSQGNCEIVYSTSGSQFLGSVLWIVATTTCPATPCRLQGGEKLQFLLILDLDSRCGEWSASRSGRALPQTNACPSNISLLYFIWEYKLCSFPQPPPISFLCAGYKYPPQPMFSDTIKLHSSFTVRAQTSHAAWQQA